MRDDLVFPHIELQLVALLAAGELYAVGGHPGRAVLEEEILRVGRARGEVQLYGVNLLQCRRVAFGRVDDKVLNGVGLHVALLVIVAGDAFLALAPADQELGHVGGGHALHDVAPYAYVGGLSAVLVAQLVVAVQPQEVEQAHRVYLVFLPAVLLRGLLPERGGQCLVHQAVEGLLLVLHHLGEVLEVLAEVVAGVAVLLEPRGQPYRADVKVAQRMVLAAADAGIVEVGYVIDDLGALLDDAFLVGLQLVGLRVEPDGEAAQGTHGSTVALAAGHHRSLQLLEYQRLAFVGGVGVEVLLLLRLELLIGLPQLVPGR